MMQPVPPYVSIDLMREIQREQYEEKWGPLGPYDGERRSVQRWEATPDPIGAAMMRLRPIERAQALFGRVARFVGRPAEAPAQDPVGELSRVPDGVRDQCT